VFDRSAPLPTGGYLEHADGTAWMALFCQNMVEVAAELARTDVDYAEMALKFVENEFLSPYGLRSLSRYHAEHPYVARVGAQEFRVSYMSAESDSGMFGRNSNWRGPIWMPVNALIIRALLQYYLYYGNDFTIECPTGSGQRLNLLQVAQEITRRLSNIFLRDKDGRRPVYGGTRTFQENPHWRDYLLFYEYFHGNNGAGLGASHQTGWTGIIARLMHVFATVTPEDVLEGGKKSYAETTGRERSPLADASGSPAR
jgi:hypothetical protein